MTAMYFVQAVGPKGEHFIYETTLEGANRSALVGDLASGQYDVGPIERVIEIDLSMGYSRDASASIAFDVADYSRRHEQELHDPVKSFVEAQGFKTHSEPDLKHLGPRLWRTRIHAAALHSRPRAPRSQTRARSSPKKDVTKW
jgi:hypothetical protein